MTRAVHPVADLFPMLGEEELGDLAADIAERGLLQPIVLDTDGRVLDGRNRLAACERAGVEPEFTTYDGDDPDGYALAVNIARRHLTKGQQAMVAAQARSVSERPIRALAEAAKLSTGRVSQAATVLDYAPDLAAGVVAGTTPLDKAYVVARERKQAKDSDAARMDALRAGASDLADLVVEERMSLGDAIAAMKQRERDLEEQRKDYTRSLGDVLVTAYALLNPDPADAVASLWDRSKSTHVNLPMQDERFTAKGIRATGDLLHALADYVEDHGGAL